MPATVAAVTGATRGIGRAIAVRLAEEGATVAVGGRDASEGARTVELIEQAGATGVYTRLDVTDADAVRAGSSRPRPTTAACTGSSTTRG